ncbi:MAG: PD-(D/E)XK nuclease family protein [Desulfarculus sp.]|nr:PD-(D/E)XK nuclease family protein [Desulfarculus sp.]
MNRGGLLAEVWPSRLALEDRRRALGRAAPGGLLLAPPLFTFEGQFGLLGRMLSDRPRDGLTPLAELAGPLLLHDLLRAGDWPQAWLQGPSASRRLPHRLWRLLVQVKAAGLGPGPVAELARKLGGERLAGLAGLLAQYQARLEELSLADEADLLAQAELRLRTGWRPGCLAGVSNLKVCQTLWLRPLDLRLLQALSAFLAIEVEFGLSEPRAGRPGVWQLLRATAEALESGRLGELEVTWRDPAREGGLLAGTGLGLLDLSPADAPASGLTLWRAGGRYAEVEALVSQALDLVESGVQPHEIALVFPDLSLYGPMAADVAHRLNLPLFFRRGLPLGSTPLTLAFLTLAELPLKGYPRAELGQVLESPYLAPALTAWLLGDGQPPAGASRRLARAGYVDGRETPAAELLARRGENDARLARLCSGLREALTGLGLERTQDLASYLAGLQELWRQISRHAPAQKALPGRDGAIWVRDQAAASALGVALAQLSRAARQVGASQALTPGRCLALAREGFSGVSLADGGGTRGAVAVLRLEDTLGLRPAYLLAGGLNQDEFPPRPAAHLLAPEERLALGRRAGLPVWRTEEEEYGGQVLRLGLLLAGVGRGAWLSCAAADEAGRELRPSFVFQELADRHGVQEPDQGGAFGRLPDLAKAREPLALWGGLTRALLSPGAAADERELAAAVLAELARDPASAQRWRGLVLRARQEERRQALDLLPIPERVGAADAFSGRMTSPSAVAHLAALLARPEWRKLSPTSLEAYVTCPQAWWLGRMLRLDEPESPTWDLDAAGEGVWVHRALALYFAEDTSAPPRDSNDPGPRLAACLDQAEAALRQAGRSGHPSVNQARREVLLAGLTEVLRREEEALAGWQVVGLERELDQIGLALAVDQGPPLVFSGRIDRLERTAEAVRVTDYKHSRNHSKLRRQAYPPERPPKSPETELTNFQLPIYLAAAVQAVGWPGGGLQGRLVNTLRPREKVVPTRPLPPGDAFLESDPGRRAELARSGEINLYNAVAELWNRLAGGDFVARPEKEHCGFCPYRLVCRARVLTQVPDQTGEGEDA